MRNDGAAIAALVILLPWTVLGQEAPEQSEMGRRLVADGYPFIIPKALEDEVRAGRAQMRSAGYTERLSDIPRAEFVLGRMDDHRRGVEAVRARGSQSAELDFVELAEFDSSALGFKPSTMPTLALNAASRAYVLQASQSVFQRVYTETSFGTLLVDEYVGKVYGDAEPDLVVVGQPAWRAIVKYDGEKWTTAIAVHADNGRLLIIEADRRFEGQSERAFISLVEYLVSSTY